MEYGTKDKQGDIVILKENVEEVNQKINELMDIESDIEIMKIPLEELEGYELNMEDIEGIQYMVK